MYWLISAATPSPDGPQTPPSLKDAQESAGEAAGWLEENWADWLAAGLRLVFIVVVAFVLRYVIRRAITKLIDRMNRRAEVVDSGNALRGLLVNSERRRQRSEAIGSVLRNAASFIILGTAALTVLSALGINLGPLLASAGVAGVALGFGARNLVQDWLAGMFMLLEDQYGVGDRVDAGEASGVVLEIGLRVTQLRGDGGEIWYIRNGEIKRVGNLSQGWAMAMLDVRVRATEDMDEVKSVILAAGAEMALDTPWDEILWEPVEVLGLDEVTLDSMVLRVSAKTMATKSLGVERELRWRIKKALDERGIRLVDEEGLTLAANRPSVELDKGAGVPVAARAGANGGGSRDGGGGGGGGDGMPPSGGKGEGAQAPAGRGEGIPVQQQG